MSNSNIALIVALWLASLGGVAAQLSKAETYHHPRFEKVLYEEAENSGVHMRVFEVWHDKDSGQEFTCLYTYHDNPSCFPTGRNWKHE